MTTGVRAFNRNMLRPATLALAATGLFALARPAAAEGVDFIADAKLLYRVAACGNAGSI